MKSARDLVFFHLVKIRRHLKTIVIIDWFSKQAQVDILVN